MSAHRPRCLPRSPAALATADGLDGARAVRLRAEYSSFDGLIVRSYTAASGPVSEPAATAG
eukprot:scaffold28582_cov95-Isochrysis_galbana.AAC.1